VLPEPIALVSDLAEPQRRALAGQSGTVIGLDYRGETVLAAHEPVAFVDMGIVAKIDLAEVRAPFVRAGLWAAMVALVVVLSGTGFFFWIANPILRTLEARSRELELEVEQRKRAQAQVANQRDQLRTQVETRTAELAELTEEQRLILDTLEATVWYKDTENRFMRVNRAAAESVGLPVHAIEGRSAEDLFPEHAAQYHRDDLEVIESGKPKLGIVEPLQTRSGDVLWVQTDKVPIFNDDGEVTGVIAHAVDITERVQAEEDLQSLTDELRKTVGLMVGRENRMVELKETIRSLREQLVAANLEPVADDPLLGGQAPEKAQPAPGTGQPEPNEAEDHQEAPLL